MLSKQQFSRFLVLVSVLLGNLVFTPLALGQNRLPDQWEGSEFRPPSNIGTPRSTQSGGRRNGGDRCVAPEYLPPTALVPRSGFGLTQESYPQISWYLPPNNAQALEVIIFNDQDQEIYSTWYTLNPSILPPRQDSATLPPNQSLDKGKIMSLQIPQNIGLSPLEIGKVYYWEVSLICDMNNRTRDLPTGGYIQRIVPNDQINTQLQQASPSEKIFLYANARLWYETLATLVNLEQLRPQGVNPPATMDSANINTVWIKLLNSAGLEQIAQQPVFIGAANPRQ